MSDNPHPKVVGSPKPMSIGRDDFSETFDDDIEPIRPIPPPRRTIRYRPKLALFLFLATCASTYLAGGLAFSLPLILTLGAHELGHFFQARRNGVPASLPYFIPMPLSLIGTMGAVIAMQPGIGNRKALFDIAITGPLAGLVPTLVFSWIGLSMSEVVSLPEIQHEHARFSLGEPLLFKFLVYSQFGTLQAGEDVVLHQIAFAGWVGLLITALNLIPIGQLDGGHILYALLRTKAYPVAKGLLFAAIAAVIVSGYWGWSLMIFFLLIIGPVHPPTADDEVPLGIGRVVLGWASLLFVFVGFTPTPIIL